MKKLLLFFLLFFTFSLSGKAQIYFSFDSIASPPYICQANTFTVEVFGTRSSGAVQDASQNFFTRNDTIFVQFHFQSGFGPGVPLPLQRQILVPAPPIGQYKVFVQGFYAGQLHKTIETRLSVCAGIAGKMDDPIKKPGIEIFPNPTAAILLFRNLPFAADAFLYDFTGKILIQKHLIAPQSEIDLAKLPAGIYLLTLQAGAKTYSKRIIKE